MSRYFKPVYPLEKPIKNYSGFYKSEAIEKWGFMRENTRFHFKWTPQVFGVGFLWFVFLPTVMTYTVAKCIYNKEKRNGVKKPIVMWVGYEPGEADED